MADQNKKIKYTIEVNDKGKVKIDGLTKGFVGASNAVKALNKDLIQQGQIMTQNTKTNQNMIDKTGLAGATIVELGRTISDSNYGIRGMANNLSQLSTLMITLISTTGGLKEGIKALTKAFMGPLGLIIGFQVVIALIERFDMQSKKTEESVDSFEESIARSASALKILRDLSEDNAISKEELGRTVIAVNAKYKDLNISLDENGKLTEESRKQIDLKILSLERLAKATAIQKELEDLFADIVKVQLEEEEKLQEAEENQFASRVKRMTNTGAVRAKSTEQLKQELKERQDAIKASFEDEKNELKNRVEILKNILSDEDLVDELFGKKGGGSGTGLPKRAKEILLEFDGELKNFFIDIDKDGVEGVLVKGIERVKRIYEPLFESGKEGSEQLKRLGEDFKDIQDRNQESLKNGLAFIKEQAKDVTDLFKATQQSLKFVGDTILSYHDARMDALKRERDYVLNSGELTGSAQKKAIEDIERRELQAQRRKIKAERDLFTIKQSLLIAEELMRIKADFAERKRMFEQQTVYFVNAQGRIVAKAAESTADAAFSIGEFTRQLGPLGIAVYAVTIGGLIASILSARKKAQATLSSLGAPSAGGGGSIGGGGGVEAPDFNVVGASPESQLAQSVSQQQTQPLRAFVVHKDIKTAEELERNTIKSLG